MEMIQYKSNKANCMQICQDFRFLAKKCESGIMNAHLTKTNQRKYEENKS